MDLGPEVEATGLLRRLVAARVDFVVIGGIAVVLHGSARYTKDLDITYATDAGNLERLGRALVDLGARLRGVPEDVPFIPDHRTLANVMMLTLDTPIGSIDVLAQPAGSPPYAELRARAVLMEIGGFSIRVAGIEDLMAMKRAAGRPQDIADLDELEAIRRLTR